MAEVREPEDLLAFLFEKYTEVVGGPTTADLASLKRHARARLRANPPVGMRMAAQGFRLVLQDGREVPLLDEVSAAPAAVPTLAQSLAAADRTGAMAPSNDHAITGRPPVDT